jgi:hypothetical protein
MTATLKQPVMRTASLLAARPDERREAKIISHPPSASRLVKGKAHTPVSKSKAAHAATGRSAVPALAATAHVAHVTQDGDAEEPPERPRPKTVFVPNLATGDRLANNLTPDTLLEFLQTGTPKIGEPDNSMYIAANSRVVAYLLENMRRNYATAPAVAPPVQGVCDVIRSQKVFLPGDNTHIVYEDMELLLATMVKERRARAASSEAARLEKAHLLALKHVEPCTFAHDESEMREAVGPNEEPCQYGRVCIVNLRYGWVMKAFQISAEDKRNKVRTKPGACLVCKRYEQELMVYYFVMSGEKVDRSIIVGNWCNYLDVQGEYRHECVIYPDALMPAVAHNNFKAYVEKTVGCVRHLAQDPVYYRF